jgi:branched-chain amino acid transport system substrate-binding protein
MARLLAGWAAAGLLLLACGSGTANTATGGGITTNGSGAVGYGVLSCFTGILAPLGRAMLQGSQVARHVINAQGGVLGKQLAITHADTGCNTTDAPPAVRQLLGTDHAVGIIGPETDDVASVVPIVTQARIPTEYQGGGASFDHNTNPYLWRDSPSDSQLAVAMALHASKAGYGRGANLFYSNAGGQSFAEPITHTFQKLGGKIVANVTVTPDLPSYRTQLQQLVAVDPQVIFTQTDAATAAQIFRDVKDLNGSSVHVVGSDVTASGEYLKAITYPVAHARLVSIYGTSVAGPAADAFNHAFGQTFGSGVQPLANANYAYDAVISLALAMDRAGTTDGPSVVKMMKEVTNPPGTACYAYAACLGLLHGGKKINYEGATGDLNYDRYHNVFGPYGAFRATLSGDEEQVGTLSASELAAATPS